MCGNNRAICPELLTARLCGGIKIRPAESKNTPLAAAIFPTSGRTNPAIARNTVVLPLPEGPNNTVHGCVRVKFTSSKTAPTRCRIATVSRLSDKVSLPSLYPPQRWH